MGDFRVTLPESRSYNCLLSSLCKSNIPERSAAVALSDFEGRVEAAFSFM